MPIYRDELSRYCEITRIGSSFVADGTREKAELVGSDQWTDLAVIRIANTNVSTVAEFANSDEVEVGQTAIAIGSPLGSEFATSVTQGIVSATNRAVATDVDGDGQEDWVVTAIQTDAAINPGNSGGALINSAGQVIGINSMKISKSSVEGMGFAIPSNEVVSIIKQLETDGENYTSSSWNFNGKLIKCE